MKNIDYYINKYFLSTVLLLTFSLSLGVFIYNFQHGYHLPYADSISRLNIARKVVDNITPGLAQLGNVWLPLPQIVLLPFIWNDFLWHSGIAGTITSSVSYILASYFIYKSSYLLTKSKFASLSSLLIYSLNINILYLQTTAMSEALFTATLAASIYYFLEWFIKNQKISLIFAAFSVCAMTLTRYEGLALLLSSIPVVFTFTYIKSRKYSLAEGNTVIYSTLACLGFGLWTLYLTVIFGNPLYWKDYYATPQATGGISSYSQAKPFLDAVWQYYTSYSWMVGIIPAIYSIISIFLIIYQTIKKESYLFLPLLMPLSIFLFMVLTLQRNTPIVQPDLNIANILSGETSKEIGFNIRYGLLLLPWVAIVSSYLFNLKIFRFLFLVVFSIQIISYFSPTYTPIYQIPANIYGKPYGEFVIWMKNNYDSGKILISASSHEDQMFEMGFDYKTFIHEGTNKYWKESLDNPSRYAKWVVIDPGHPQDQVAIHMNREDILEREYKLLYNKEQIKVYKKIKKPYYEIRVN